MLSKMLSVLLTMLVMTSVVSGRQDCTQPSGATRVDDNYQPSATGNWWLMDNWRDTNGPGGVPDGFIKAGDFFNFNDPVTGQAIRMADSAVFRYQYQGETYYFVTGTAETFGTGNVPIYRTKNFRQFTLHMLAFDESNQNGSQQYRVGDAMHIGPDYYAQIWGPQLLANPIDAMDNNLYLTFNAIENATNPDGAHDWHSVFQVTISKANFEFWFTATGDRLTIDGPRFGDPRHIDAASFDRRARRFGYQGSVPLPYPTVDGGYGIAKFIPTSISPEMFGPNCGNVLNWVWHPVHQCHGAATSLYLDGQIAFDPKRSITSPWRQLLFYTWAGADPSSVPYDQRGEHIAMAAMQSMRWLRSDQNLLHVAACRNTNNGYVGLRHDGSTGYFPNGAMDNNGNEADYGAIAEGVCAFYNAQNDRYYVIYTRNLWTSPGYQLVYRKTNAGQFMTDLSTTYNNQSIPESVLLRSINSQSAGKHNFGNARVYTMPDPLTGQDRYYIVFHVKFDDAPTNRRTTWFKELTFLADGSIRQLQDGGTDSAVNAWKFRVPACPVGACCSGPSSCALTDNGACVSASGIFLGNGTTCSPTACIANCCRGTTCISIPRTACVGDYAGSQAQVIESTCTGNTYAGCCYADFSHTNGVTIDDQFLYMNAYFSGSPWANYNGDGVASPTIDDMFIFINLWNAGCN